MRSGPLSGRDMPRPSVLGAGWAFRVDDGSQEDGYAGNGTPTLQRGTGLVQHLRRVAGLAVSTRTEAGDLHDGSPWTEIARVGSPDCDVTLVAINTLPAAPVARRVINGSGSAP